MVNTVVMDADVKKFIAGDDSFLRDAQPFLRLLSRTGGDYLNLPDDYHIPYDSVKQLGDYLRGLQWSGDAAGVARHNAISRFLDFAGQLILIHEETFALESLRGNSFGLFACWIAAHCFFGDANKGQAMSPIDDKQKFENIMLLVNGRLFEYDHYHNEQDPNYIAMAGGTTNNVKKIIRPSELEGRKKIFIAAIFHWWNENKIKEFPWLPMQTKDVKDAKWCWDRIKTFHEKKKLPLSLPSSGMYPQSCYWPFLASALEKACGEQYQLAVYTYFCFISEPFTRDMVRNKIATLYRAKNNKDKNKGRIINVAVSEDCKNKFDRLTRFHNKKQADMLNELIDEACKKLPQQGRP